MTIDKLRIQIAKLMPDWLIYFCGIVLWTHATTGEYRDTEVPAITMDEVLRRWDKK